MAKRTKAEADETRSNILEAAVKVFSEKGVSGSSLNEIAKRADVTRGAIYWHFKNKVDIFEALHEQMHQSMMEVITEDLETDHPNPLIQLEKLCSKLLLDVELNSAKKNTLNIFFLGCDYSGEMNVLLERQRESKEECVLLFTGYFERAIKRGHLDKATDTRMVALSLLFFLTGMIFEYLRNPSLIKLIDSGPALMAQYFKSFQ